MARKNLGVFSANLILMLAVLWVSPLYGQYILNNATKVYHINSGCRAVPRIAPENYEVSATIPAGYSPCRHPECGPDRHVLIRDTQPAVRQTTPTPAARQEIPARGSWTPGSTIVPTPAPSPAPTTVNRATPQPAEPPQLQWGWQKVARVVDGDTFVLENGQRVRLIGADTPETVHPNRPAEPYGELASNYTKEIMKLADHWVFLEDDGDKTDRFGRQLAMVWVLISRDSNPDDSKVILLNDMLIKLGIARAQTQYNYSQEMKDKFTQSEKEAREQKKRIWSQAL